MIPLDAYLDEFGCVSVGEALDILEEMGVATDRVIVYDYTTQQNRVTSIIQYCAKIPRNVKAHSIVAIQFCGGPPGNQGWFIGSLQTILIDKIMHHDIDSDRKIKESQQRIVRHIGTKVAPTSSTLCNHPKVVDIKTELRSSIKIRC